MGVWDGMDGGRERRIEDGMSLIKCEVQKTNIFAELSAPEQLSKTPSKVEYWPVGQTEQIVAYAGSVC